jgi:predicted transcriptional regulator
MEIAVPAYMKKINRSIILSKIIKHGMISRVDLANMTKLTKATISLQVADLIEEGLVVKPNRNINMLGESPSCFLLMHMLVML